LAAQYVHNLGYSLKGKFTSGLLLMPAIRAVGIASGSYADIQPYRRQIRKTFLVRLIQQSPYFFFIFIPHFY
jgi:hypothetical protein